MDEDEKEVASRMTLLDTKGEALATTEKKKAAELACFPDNELKLRMAFRCLCRDGLDKLLATPEGTFAALTTELAVALEDVVIQVEKILDSE